MTFDELHAELIRQYNALVDPLPLFGGLQPPAMVPRCVYLGPAAYAVYLQGITAITHIDNDGGALFCGLPVYQVNRASKDHAVVHGAWV